TGSDTDTLGSLGLVMVWIGMAVVNSIAGHLVYTAILAGQRFDIEQQGKIVISHQYLIEEIRERETAKSEAERLLVEDRLEDSYKYEAEERSEKFGGSEKE